MRETTCRTPDRNLDRIAYCLDNELCIHLVEQTAEELREEATLVLVIRNLLFGETQHNGKELRQYDRRCATSVGVNNLPVRNNHNKDLV